MLSTPGLGRAGVRQALSIRTQGHPGPQVPLVLEQREAANTIPFTQDASWPRPPLGAPNLLGRQPPLTHILMTCSTQTW